MPVHPDDVAHGVAAVPPEFGTFFRAVFVLVEVVDKVPVVVKQLLIAVVCEDSCRRLGEVRFGLAAGCCRRRVRGCLVCLCLGGVAESGIGFVGGWAAEGFFVTGVGVVHDSPVVAVVFEQGVVGLCDIEVIGCPASAVEMRFTGTVLDIHERSVVVVYILSHCQSDLLEIGGTGDGSCLFPRL